MTTSEIHERLKTRFPEAISGPSEGKGDAWLTVKAGALVEVCRFL